MIKIDNAFFTLSNCGLFTSNGIWIHPTVIIDSYELIFVTEGEVHIQEGGQEFHLTKGDMLYLAPGINHGGVLESESKTQFYWLHFYTDNADKFLSRKLYSPQINLTERVFNEVIHYQKSGLHSLAELIITRFLLENLNEKERKNKIAYQIEEYVRMTSHRNLSVSDLANRFGYTSDYISKLIRSEFGMSAKELISENRIKYIESQLINTNLSIKELSFNCGFQDENLFVKFFKYHTGKTPTDLRNEFFRSHMNEK